MPINQINNGDSGLVSRTIINELVNATNTLSTSGSASYALSSSYSSYALSASYAPGSISASYAETASYISNAESSSYA